MFKYKLQETTIDVNSYKKSLKSGLLELRNDAARQFVETVFTALPVWSGAARATLVPLGRLVNLGTLTTQINPVVSGPFKNTREHGIAAGLSAGSGSKVYQTRYSAGFIFDLGLFHYLLNEYNAMPYGPDKKPTPWETIKEGIEAYLAYLSTQGGKYMPKIFRYMSKRVIK